MDKQLATEWQALKKAHDDAHHRYLYVHGLLADRIAAAASGARWPTPLMVELEAHEAATERWDRAKRQLHAFCHAHEDVC